MKLLGAVVAVLLFAPAAGAADGLTPMLGSDTVTPSAQLPQDGSLTDRLVARAEPELQASPRADCNAQSSPEPLIQGRVPPGPGSKDGFHCNFTLLGHTGKSGGFKVERFVDTAGHECAYYDTSLIAFSNAFTLGGTPTGTAVVDMTNPANPVRTDTLLTPAMQSPHESLLVNQKRGLLAAVMGTPAVAPGFVDVYDLNKDCRHPELQSSLPVGLLGHESGWTKDGLTFYATAIGAGLMTAVDMTNPKLPYTLTVFPSQSHGTTLSDDGNRAYVASLAEGLVILDTSEIQARKPDPQVRVVSKLTWSSLSTPQNAQPFTVDGHPYLLETDEFSAASAGSPIPVNNGPVVGAARIIDIADETQPRVVSNLRLEVHQPENREAIKDDPGAGLQLQGYAGHYCQVEKDVDPKLVACSMIVSGLRVFDISKLDRPKELGYFVAPPAKIGGNALGDNAPANFAMSRPTIVPERQEIWYSDGNSGLYALKADPGVWPSSSSAPQRCKRVVKLKLRTRFKRAKVFVAGKRVKVRRRGGRLRARAVLRGPKGAKRKVRIVARTKAGKRVKRVRRYPVCSQ